MINFIIFVLIIIFIPSQSMAESPRRIVSLAPNVTEILYELGLGDRVVGVSTYCNYPPEVKIKPKIGGMSNPSLEAVIALKPDMVVLTDDGNPRMIAERLTALKVPIYIFRVRRIADLPGAIRTLGAAFGVTERADRSAHKIEQVFHNYTNRYRHQTQVSTRKVLFVMQTEPLMVAGPNTAIDDILNLLGLVNIAGDAPPGYPHFSLEEVIRRSPDIIFMVKTPNGMSEPIIPLLAKLKTLEAVREGRVCNVGDPVLRMGPRLAEGIEEISRCLKITKP